MKIDEKELIRLRARAMALDSSLAEQKDMLERGMIDPPAYSRLSADFKRQKHEILLTLKQQLAGADPRLDDVLDGAIDGSGEHDDMAEQLKQVAEDRKLGAKIVDSINKNKGSIISWVVDIGLAIGKAVA